MTPPLLHASQPGDPITFDRHRRFASAGGGTGLTTGLLEWWDLDETSGNALSANGGNDLTDNNTVGYSASAAPDGGNARSFTASNSEYFSVSAGNVLNSGSAVTIAWWSNVNSTGGNKCAFGHNAPNGHSNFMFTAATNFGYLNFDGALSKYRFVDQSGAWHSYIITSTGPGGADAYYIDNSSTGIGGTDQGWEPGSAIFYLGASESGLAYFDGEICSFGIWDHVFSADERAAFHNSGTNLRYADL